jgi:hypothetical protein
LGDFCTGCGQKFVRNLSGFDTLPLVEFAPSANIDHIRVIECLKMDPPENSGFGQVKAAKKGRHQDGW